MRPLLPAYSSSQNRDAHDPHPPAADGDGRDADRDHAGGGAQQGGPEDDAVDDEEVERIASWLSLFRMLVIFLPLFALCLPTLLGDWERARRNETMIASRKFISLVTPRGSSLRRQALRTTCRTEACMAAAANVSLDPATNPCDDLFGYVCNNWIRNHHVDDRTEPWEVRRDRRTMDHKHQAALSSALHKLLAGRAGKRWFPAAMRRLYRKCLEPGPNDGAELRSKLLESAGISPWPQKPWNATHSGDVSKVLGNAYYFTNEPALMRMGVDVNGRVFLAEPRLLLDTLTVGPAEVAQAAAAVFSSAGGKLPPPVDVNRLEGLLDKARRGDDQPPWDTTLRLPEAENGTVAQNASEAPLGAWTSWNLRTIVEEAFESQQELDEVVLRAPSYVNALPNVLKKLKEHELINYLGLRTALLASRLLPPGPEKQLLCRLLDVDDEAPARTAAEHCVRMIGKYEPALALYALATWSPLVNGLDAEVLLSFLRRQLSNLVREGDLDTSDESLAARMGDLVDSLPWAGPAPRWLSNAMLREAYVSRFYNGSTAPVSSRTSQAVFAWMQEKAVNEHLALNEPQRAADTSWALGLLSTRCRLVLREEESPARSGDDESLPDATLQVPPAALDLLWGINPSTAMLQVPRVGVRAFQPVLGHLFRWQLRQLQQNDAAKPPGYSRCSFWRASPDHLDAALETRALSLALRAFLSWPGAPELALPGLEQLEPEQLFFIFYVLNQCESNGPDVQQTLAARHRQRDDGVRADRAGWVNRVASANEDFARAFRCPPPLRSPNPYRDCSIAAAAAGSGWTSHD